MILTRLYSILFLLILLTSCTSQKNIQEIQTSSTIEFINISKTNKIDNKGILKIDLVVPIFKHKNYIFINKSVKSTIYREMNAELNNEPISENSLNNLVDNYTSLVINDYSDIDTYSFEFYNSIIIDTIYSKKSIIVLEEKIESYMGGAHGNYNTQYYTFDTKSQTQLLVNNLFNKKELTELAYNYFLEQNGLTKKEIDIEKEGYWFKDNKFHLNDNFSIDNKNLIFIFNPYEIASYAQGQIIIEIPLLKLNSIVKEEYKYIINKD